MDIILKYFTDFTDQQKKQLGQLKDLYSAWNEKINVISRKDMEHFYEHHVLHSLAIATQFNFTGMNIMDLGTGGGFPGIPLAIFFPEARFLLVDSIRKKLLVVDEIVKTINLLNVTTEHTRAENLRTGKFDFVVSRAVAPLKDLLKWSGPLIKKQADGGGLICLKGGDLTNEIHECNCRPRIWEIEKIFDEPFFKEKYMLHT